MLIGKIENPSFKIVAYNVLTNIQTNRLTNIKEIKAKNIKYIYDPSLGGGGGGVNLRGFLFSLLSPPNDQFSLKLVYFTHWGGHSKTTQVGLAFLF